ncbi:phage tail tape measure protein [Gluconobacter sp. LMG 31484]|uniref:Phage tail tape measure protein n=1 Tax=Gluconobacter vitians TaxID=2728102 RepID=A0ABR9Y4D5_9PROT|nr:phage tail tape measure protein [Gluconobacter vitians]MBF0858795.1 phage tail tape measure protein [Gluconobacter vitians]
MSGSLTAQFELTLVDQMSGPVEKIEQGLDRLNSFLDKLAHNPAFDEVWEPVPRCVEQTTALSETLEQATSAATVLGEGLEVAATAATEAGSAMEMAAEGAGVLDAALARTGTGSDAAVIGLNAVTEAAERTSAAIDRASRTPGFGAPRFPGDAPPGESEERPGYGRRVWGSVHEFGHAAEHSGMQLMGAAGTGLMFIEPIHASADYQNNATHIGITLGKHGTADYTFAQEWERDIDRMARAYGQNSSELMESSSFLSMEGYSEQRLRAFLPTIAEISTAYNARPDPVGRTAFSLEHSLGINSSELPQGLADLARVGKISALDMSELAPLFPEVAAHAGGLGMHGLRDVADLGAMLAVARKSVGQAGSATADLTNFMQTLTSQHGIQRMGKVLHVDSVHQIVTDVKAGRDPLEHFIDEIAAIHDPEKRLRVVTSLFANQQDQGFARALSGNILSYRSYRDEIRGTSPAMIKDDYDTARSNSQLTQLNAFEDSLTQTGRHIGTGFVPTMDVLTTGFHHLLDAWDELDKKAPGVDTAFLTVTAGALALGTGVGVLGAAAGPMKAGSAIITTAFEGIGVAGLAATFEVGIFVAGMAAAGYAIYHNWDHIKGMFVSFEHWISGWGDRVSGMVSGAFTHMFPHFPGSSSMSGPLVVPTTGPGWNPGGSHPPLKVDITHAPGLHVTASPHPAIHATVLPSGGRMMNRP